MTHDIATKESIKQKERRKIKLEDNSLKRLIGHNCNDVMVYGLHDCLYYDVMDALNELNINVNCWSGVDFPVIKFDEIAFNPNNMNEEWPQAITHTCREYKSIITSLIIENCKRDRIGKPLIPLIFCIGLQEAEHTVTLNSKKVAESHRCRDRNKSIEEVLKDPFNSSVTEKELRRCYKIYAEGTQQIKNIAEKTFKFVKLNQHPQNKNLYSLEPLLPFWNETSWQQTWQQRKLHPLPVQFPKKYDWRKMLTTTVSGSIFIGSHRFFRPTETVCEENDLSNNQSTNRNAFRKSN